jgi:hypothetical protein
MSIKEVEMQRTLDNLKRDMALMRKRIQEIERKISK